ncbi:hypothetical protein LCGC14_1775640 [marine sediment metagenome]|uniref:Uncharacterized protein n=1 Tax=marine sediment metagenome TaxID=412755 RepID=A0A0F9JBW0_9ZZZZ
MAKVVAVEGAPAEMQWAEPSRSFTDLMDEHVMAVVAYALGKKTRNREVMTGALSKLQENRVEWANGFQQILGTGGLPDRNYAAEWSEILGQHNQAGKNFIDGTMDGNAMARLAGFEALVENRELVVAFFSSIPAYAIRSGEISALWQRHLVRTAEYVDSLNRGDIEAFRGGVDSCRSAGQQLGSLLDQDEQRSGPFNWIKTPIPGFNIPVPKPPHQVFRESPAMSNIGQVFGKLAQAFLQGAQKAPIYGPETRYEYYDPYRVKSGIPGLVLRFSEFPQQYETSYDPRTSIEVRFKNTTDQPMNLHYGVFHRYCRYQTGDRYCDWDKTATLAIPAQPLYLAPGATREVDLLMPTPPQPVANGNVGDIRRLEMQLVARDEQGRQSVVVRQIRARESPPII